MGARSAGNPHAACDVEGTGNVARTKGLPARQSSTLLIGGSRKRRHHSKPGPRLDPTRPKQSWTICADKRVDTARCAIEADMPDRS
jgi:hypothetical protein